MFEIVVLVGPAATVVAVEHRGRLGRMNTERVEAAPAAHHRRLVVLGNSEVTGGLVRGMIEVLVSLCARLYGRRSARDRALKAIGCAQCDVGRRAVLTAGSTRCGGGAASSADGGGCSVIAPGIIADPHVYSQKLAGARLGAIDQFQRSSPVTMVRSARTPYDLASGRLSVPSRRPRVVSRGSTARACILSDGLPMGPIPCPNIAVGLPSRWARDRQAKYPSCVGQPRVSDITTASRHENVGSTHGFNLIPRLNIELTAAVAAAPY